MSWEAVTYWHLRCDGIVTGGQCRELFRWFDEDELAENEALEDEYGELDTDPVPYAAPSLREVGYGALRSVGWRVLDERVPIPTHAPVLCTRHVAAAEYLTRAQAEGLPFDEIGWRHWGDSPRNS